jgi:hypothetical protein
MMRRMTRRMSYHRAPAASEGETAPPAIMHSSRLPLVAKPSVQMSHHDHIVGFKHVGQRHVQHNFAASCK